MRSKLIVVIREEDVEVMCRVFDNVNEIAACFGFENEPKVIDIVSAELEAKGRYDSKRIIDGKVCTISIIRLCTEYLD